MNKITLTEKYMLMYQNAQITQEVTSPSR